MNKKLFILMSALVVLFALLALPAITGGPGSDGPGRASLAGRYVGYSWGGEADGVELADANQYIEAIVEIDESGVITAAKMRFFVQKEGFWIPRQSGNSYVDVDFSVDPSPAVPGDNYSPGDSMFTVYNADMMSFYAVAVDNDATAAVVLVCPATRYQFEIKLPPGFDYETSFGELTVGSGMLVPTIRTSGAGISKPEQWAVMADRHFLNIESYSYVVNIRGVFAGLNDASSVKDFMEAMGVSFSNGRPLPQDPVYGYFGIGGWAGNYRAIEEFLVGKNATVMTSLIDWSEPRYAGGINEENRFGIDVATGATRTVQNGVDTISGATVRMSRESTAYQRALAEAGIIDEEDVIIGRF